MIHLIEITAAITVAELKKAARRAAMTGGYELQLASGLTAEDLTQITARFLPLAAEYPSESSERRASSAYRICQLVLEHAAVDADIRDRIEQQLGNKIV